MIKVFISDKIDWQNSQDEFKEMKYWAQEHCKSFVAMNLIDVSDASLYHDYVAEFKFSSEKDATLFRLKYA